MDKLRGLDRGSDRCDNDGRNRQPCCAGGEVDSKTKRQKLIPSALIRNLLTYQSEQPTPALSPVPDNPGSAEPGSRDKRPSSPRFTHCYRTEQQAESSSSPSSPAKGCMRRSTEPKHCSHRETSSLSVKELLQIRLGPRNNFRHLSPSLLHQIVVIHQFSDPRQIRQFSSLTRVVLLPQRRWCSRGQDIVMPKPSMALWAQCRGADQRS